MTDTTRTCEDGRTRCAVFLGNDLDRRYHDEEWGTPVHDDRKLFEYLSLEVLQCGLSWHLMLERRPTFRRALADFDPEALARFDERDVRRALETPGMLRSERKVRALVGNAQAYLGIQERFGSFDRYLWRLSDGATILYHAHDHGEVPARNGLSTRLAHDLRARGLTYLGPVTAYSFLQSCGVICDHQQGCWRLEQIARDYPTVRRRRFGEA